MLHWTTRNIIGVMRTYSRILPDHKDHPSQVKIMSTGLVEEFKPARNWMLLLVCGCAIAASLPLILRYLKFLTNLPQYEFIPVFLFAWAGILLWNRKQLFKAQFTPQWGSTCLFALALAMLAVGVLISSSWFAYIAFLISFGALLSASGNWSGNSPLFTYWLALLIPLRPPIGIDISLLNWLRKIASIGASRVADLMQIPHMLEGNIFRLADKQMFMEDACSGIISFLTCVGCSAMLSLWRRRGTVHFAMLAISSACWAIVFNIVRIVCLLSSWYWFAIDLTVGWQHEVLGYVTLIASVSLTFVTDDALNWFLQDTSEARSSFTRIWNSYVANPHERSVDESINQEDPVRDKGSKKFGSWQAIGYSIVLLSLFALQVPSEVKYWRTNKVPVSKVSTLTFTPITFPERFGNWVRVPERDATQIWRLGNDDINSFQVAYRDQDRIMVVAIAYPYEDWHDVTACYENSNWKIESKDFLADQVQDGSSHPVVNAAVHLEMRRELEQPASVLFAFVDPKGQPIRAPRPSKTFVGFLRDRFGFEQEARPEFTGFLVQVLWPHPPGESSLQGIESKIPIFETVVKKISDEISPGK